MTKKIILVILISLFIGTFVFYALNSLSSDKKASPLSKVTNILKSSPTPTPIPTFHPITENSNLKEEIKNLVPNDYSEEINSLRAQ